MNVVVRGVHVEITPEIRAHVDSQLVEPLARLLPQRSVTLEVYLVDNPGTKGGHDKECRVNVFVPAARALHLSETSEDFLKSIHLLRHSLESVAKRQLARWHDHHGGAPLT